MLTLRLYCLARVNPPAYIYLSYVLLYDNGLWEGQACHRVRTAYVIGVTYMQSLTYRGMVSPVYPSRVGYAAMAPD